MTQTLRIATRKSALALWQTEHVAARLRELHPGITIELVPLSTRGDEVLDRSLAAIGGKGLFLKELEELELSDELLSRIDPLMPDHMLREECYYLLKLSQSGSVPQPDCDPAKPRIPS